MPARWNALRIALIYVLFSAVWIVGSDQLVATLFPSFPDLARAQTIKGLFYISLSALLIYMLVRRAERELKASELRLREIIEAMPDALFLLDREGRILDANAVARERYGYGSDEVPGLSLADITPPDLRAGLPERIQRALNEGLQSEGRHRRRDGTEFPVEINARSLDLAGERLVLSSVRDITGRKAIERSYQLLFATMHDAFALHDVVLDGDGQPVDFHYVTVNAAFTRLVNAPQESIIGRSLAEVLAARSDVWLPHLRRVAATGDVAHFSVNDSTGERLYEVTAYRPTQYQCACVAVDVTERQRTEQAHRMNEERLQLALAGAELGMWDWQIDTDETVYDERWADMLGYQLSEITPKQGFWHGLIHPDDVERVDATLSRHLAGLTPSYETEHRLRHRSGDWIWVLDRGKVIERGPDGAARRMCGTHLNITERKRADEERELLESQLRQAQKMEAVGQLAGGVAHDFNNLLQVINGYAELAASDLPSEAPALDAVNQIAKAGKRAAALVSQLLAFGRRQRLEIANVDLNEAIASLLVMLERVIGEHIRLTFVPGHELGNVRADPGMMEQVLMNLCVNARDAMPDGGVLTIETQNVRLDASFCETHAWARPGHYVLVSVTDTGVGMDTTTLRRIFEPFFSTKPPGRGTGLGLATVYGIVKQHGGLVHAFSEPGRGASFRIYLPARERLAAAEDTQDLQPVATGTETILVAEDDHEVRDLTREILERAGYTVVLAINGEEAVAAFGLRVKDVDLVMLDVVMPALGGREASARIRAIRNDVPVLFSSGHSEDVVEAEFAALNGHYMIRKPYTRDELLRQVREILDRRAP